MPRTARTVRLAALAALAALIAWACATTLRFDDRYLFEDGTYRGIFADGDAIQVNVEFVLRDGRVESARFRHLRRDENFFLGTEREPFVSVVQQYEEALAYLVGKDLHRHLADLYTPEIAVTTEVDGYTGATIRSAKLISAVRDALGRGVYRY